MTKPAMEQPFMDRLIEENPDSILGKARLYQGPLSKSGTIILYINSTKKWSSENLFLVIE